MEVHYCWRCRADVPMLNEAEWAKIAPYIGNQIRAIQAYRAEHHVGIAEARQQMADLACAAYERLTGYHETNFLAIYHHRLAKWGPPCPRCGRLLRTPQASFCTSCGWRPELSTGTNHALQPTAGAGRVPLEAGLCHQSVNGWTWRR